LIENDSFLRIGVIAGAHALNGRLKIYVVSDNLDRFASGETVYLKIGNNYKKYTVKEFSVFKGKYCLLRFDRINDRNSAEACKGIEIYIDREQAEKTRESLDHDAFYYFDLIGCSVYINDQRFGEVINILEAGAGEILVITDSKGKEFMVPFVDSMVNTAKISEKRLDIDPVEGLIDF